MKHYVYEWWRMDLNLPYYIGKGKGKRAHETKRNPHTDNVTASLARNGIARDVRIVAYFVSEDAAFEFEKERIAFWWHLKDHDILTNMTLGGEGAASGELNPQKRPEARVRVSIQMRGKPRDPEASRKTADKLRGRPNPRVAGQNNGMFGKKCRLVSHSEETKEKMRGPRGPEAARKRWDNISDEDRAAFRKAIGEGLKKRSPEERKEIALERWQNMNPESRERHRSNSLEGQRAYWDSLSEERREERRKINQAAQQKAWEGATEEKRKAHGEKIGPKNKKAWSNLTPEQRKARGEAISAGKRKKTPEERTASANKTWETRRAKKAALLNKELV